VSDSRPPPSAPPKRRDDDDDDDAPALEVVEEDANAKGSSVDGEPLADDELEYHEPTTQGLGFDAVGALTSEPPKEGRSPSSKRHAETGQGLGFDPVAQMLGLAPAPQTKSSIPPRSSIPPTAPEQARQTLPTRSASQKPEKPALRRISTQDFDAPDVPKALAEAEEALAASPNDVEAVKLVLGLRRQLERVYAEQLSPMTRVVHRIPEANVDSIEDEARFLLAFVDGKLSIAQVVDASAMTPVDAMRVLAGLAEKGVVRFRFR
jgi:hypothetical protein